MSDPRPSFPPAPAPPAAPAPPPAHVAGGITPYAYANHQQSLDGIAALLEVVQDKANGFGEQDVELVRDTMETFEKWIDKHLVMHKAYEKRNEALTRVAKRYPLVESFPLMMREFGERQKELKEQMLRMSEAS